MVRYWVFADLRRALCSKLGGPGVVQGRSRVGPGGNPVKVHPRAQILAITMQLARWSARALACCFPRPAENQRAPNISLLGEGCPLAADRRGRRSEHARARVLPETNCIITAWTVPATAVNAWPGGCGKPTEVGARAPARALTWRGGSPRQAEVSPACDRRLLRRGDTGWGAAGGELPVRNKASS